MFGGDLYLTTFDQESLDAVTTYLARPFEERYKIKVRVTSLVNNSDQIEGIQSCSDRSDITLCDDYMAFCAMQFAALAPLRLEGIPNYRHQHVRFRKAAYHVGDGCNYFAALVWGETGIAYNTHFVSEVPTTWEDFFRPGLLGRISMAGLPENMVMTAALMTGQDINNITDLIGIEMTLLELKQRLRSYWYTSTDVAHHFSTQEVVMSNVFRGDANKLAAAGHPVEFVVPDEGAPAKFYCLAIPEKCQNREAAEAFIDLALDASIVKNFAMQGIGCAPSTTNVILTPGQQERLGATSEEVERAKFASFECVAANQFTWLEIAKRIWAG